MFFKRHFYTRLLAILLVEIFTITHGFFCSPSFAIPFTPYPDSERETFLYLSPDKIEERARLIEELIQRKDDIQKAASLSDFALHLDTEKDVLWDKFFDTAYNFDEIKELSNFPLSRGNYEKEFSSAIFSRIIEGWGLGEERDLALPYLFESNSSYSISKSVWRSVSRDPKGSPVLREETFYGLPIGGALLSGDDPYSCDGRVIILAAKNISIDLTSSIAPDGLSREEFNLIKRGYEVKGNSPWDTYKKASGTAESDWGEVLLSKEKERLQDEFLLDLHTPRVDFSWVGRAIRVGEETGEESYTPAFLYELISGRDYDPVRAETMSRSFAYLLKELTDDKNYSDAVIEEIAASLKDEVLKYGSDIVLSLSANYADIEKESRSLKSKILKDFILPSPSSSTDLSTSPLPAFSLTVLPLKNDGTSYDRLLGCVNRGTSEAYFIDGQLVREVYPDGRVIKFSYKKDSGGNIEYIYAKEGGLTRVYDGDGQLTEVRSPDGSIIEYEGEAIQRIRDTDGAVTDFTYIRDQAKNLVEIHLKTIDSGQEQVYDSYGNLMRITQDNGTIIDYLPTPLGKYIDQFGQAHLYRVIEEDGNTYQTLLDSSGTLQVFDDDDNILSVTTAYGHKLFYAGNSLSGIESPDKFLITSPSFDREGHLIGGVVSLSEMADISLQGNDALFSDGTKFNYTGGLVNSLTTPEGIEITRIREYPDHSIHSAEISFPDKRKEIIEKGKVTKIIEPDGTVFNLKEGKITDALYADGISVIFENDLPTGIISPDGDAITIAYDRDADGQIISKRIISANNTVRTYDANNNLLRVEIPGHAPLPASSLSSAASISSKPMLIQQPDAVFKNLFASDDFRSGSFSPFELTCTTPSFFSAQVLASDGTYLYIGGIDINAKDYVFRRIGTGFNGTEKGKDYGDFVRIHQDTLFSPGPLLLQSAAFHPDGYIYIKSSSSSTKLTRINTFSGEVSEIDTGHFLSSSTRITSDGSYLYALSPLTTHASSSTMSVTIDIFDPQADFKHVDTYTLNLLNEDIYSISSDGVYLYAFSTKDSYTRESNVSIIDLKSRSLYGTEPFFFPGPAGPWFAFSSQYDAVNNQFWTAQSRIRVADEESNVLPYNIYLSSERRLNFTGTVVADLSLDKYALNRADACPFPRGIAQYPLNIITKTFSVLEDVSGLGAYVVSSLDRELGELNSFTGLIKQLTDKSGSRFDYSYEVSPDGKFITVLSSEKDGVQRFNEKGERISLTTPEGDCLYFSSGQVTGLITAQGIKFTDPVISETGAVLSAKIIAPDNTIHFIEEGKITETRAPDGTITRYDNGSVISEEQPSGEVITRAYIKNNDGSIKEERRSDGTIINYSYTRDENGMVTNISTTDQNGKIFLYDSSQNLISITQDDIITHYNKGRVYLVTDKNDSPLIEYLYDYEGNIYEIRSDGLHNQLESRIKASQAEIDFQYNSTYESIFQEVSGRLSEIAVSVGEAYKPVDQLLLQVQEIWANNSPHMHSDVHDQLSAMMSQACAQRDQILSDKLKAYNDVEENKLSALAALKENRDASLSNLSLESMELRERLYIQEVLGMVPVYYASILGRSVDEDEIAFWLDKFKSNAGITAAAIQDYLYALPEYSKKTAFQKEVIEGVRSWFQDNPGKISTQELKCLLRQLQEENIHFLSSAIENLIKLFDDAGVIASEAKQSNFARDIAIEALVIDILEGNITSLKQEDLKLSLYSLSTVAKKHGLDLTAARIDPADLVDLPYPAMVLIEGDHFATVREVTADKVVYYESNLGPQGKDVIVSPEEFQKLWKDKVVLTKELPSDALVLSQSELLAFRGAGLFSWIGNVFKKVANAIGDVFQSIGRVAVKAAEAFGNVVKGIVMTPIRIIENIKAGKWGAALLDIGLIAVTFFTPITSAINSFLTATLSPIFAPIASALKTVAGALWNGAKTVVTSIGAGISKALPGFSNFTTSVVSGVKNIGATIGKGIKFIGGKLGYGEQKNFLWETAKTALDTSITVGVQESLKALKIETPIISSMISSGITGSFYDNKKEDFFNKHLITGAARGTVLELGEELKIDPSLTNIASIVVDQALSNKLLGTEGDGIPTLMGELAYYGVQELGEALGIDDRISQLAGIPLKVTAANSLSANKDLTVGLRAGFTSVLLERIAQEEDIDPLYASIATRTLTSGLIKVFNEDLATDKTNLLNFFKGSYDGILSSTKASLTLGRTGTDFDLSAYKTKLFDFSTRIREDSLTSALRNSFTSTFHRQAVNDLTATGGLIDYLNGNVNKIEITSFDNPEVDTYVGKKLFKQVKVGNNEYQYFDLSTGNLSMIGEGTYYYDSKLKLPLLQEGKYKILTENGKYLEISINPPSASSLLNLPKLDTPSKERLLFVFRLTRETDDSSLRFSPSSLQGKAIYPRQSPLSTDSYSFIATARYNKTTSSGLFNNQGASGETSSSSSARFDSYEFLNPNPYSSGFELNFDSLSLDSFALNNIDNEMLYANMPIFTQRLHAKLLQELYAPVEPQTAGLKFAGILPPSEFIERNSIDFEKNSSSAIIDNFLFSPSAMSPDIFFRPLLRNPFDATLPWEVRINPYNLIHYLQPSPTQTFFANQFSLITNFWGNQLHNAATFLRIPYDYAKDGYNVIDTAQSLLRGMLLHTLTTCIDTAQSLGVKLLDKITAYNENPDWEPKGLNENTHTVAFPGTGNMNPEGFSPQYLLDQKLAVYYDSGKNEIAVVSLYEHSKIPYQPVAIIKDIGWWIADKIGINKISNELEWKLDKVFASLPPEAIARGQSLQLYSGAGQPALKVLNRRPDFNIKSINLYGAPITAGFKGVVDMKNPNVKYVTNTYGTKDKFRWVGGLVGPKQFKNVTTYNIEISGTRHEDYFNSDGSTASVSVNTYNFTKAMTKTEGDEVRVKELLHKPFIKVKNHAKFKKIYIVDTLKLKLETIP